MKDYYKVIGTSKEAVYSRSLNATEKEVNEFIEEKYLDKIKWLERKISFATSEEREILEKEKLEIIRAYNEIKDEKSRNLYNEECKSQETNNDIVIKSKKKNAYNRLNVTEERIENLSEEEANKLLEEKKDKEIAIYKETLEKEKDFRKKKKIEMEIQEILEAYDSIKNSQKRKEYKAEMRQEQQKQIYSHSKEHNKILIANGKGTTEEKKVIKKDVIAEEYILVDSKENNLIIQQTGIVIFENWQGIVAAVNEYRVTRENEISDIIYTNLSIPDLSVDKKTNQPYNPQYYDCVVNKLLSEDTIEGSKFNYGYIGEIEEVEEGKYDITLDKPELKESEKEKLSAVMIIKQRQLKKQEQQR